MSTLKIVGLALFVAVLGGCTPENAKVIEQEEQEVVEVVETLEVVESVEAEEEEEVQNARVEMLLAHDNALDITDLVLNLYDNVDADMQGFLQEPIGVFMEDVALLGYYIDISEHEPLTQEEQEIVVSLLLKIEDGVTFFAEILDSVF